MVLITENKHTLYQGREYIRKMYTSLRELTKSIMNFEKEKMFPLTREKCKLHQNAKVYIYFCYICEKKIFKKLSKTIKYQKARDYCHYTGKYRGVVHSICNLKFIVLNQIPPVFHNGSNYDYHFIIKELAKEFEG